MEYLHGNERTDLLAKELSGKNLGLITNPSGVSRRLEATVDRLNDGFRLRALYSPEHGVRGDAQAGAEIGTYTDPKTSLPVYSMYGKDRGEVCLDGIDCLVYDVQDVGLRFYTYIYTLTEAMEAAAKKGVPVVVLDRYDPLGLSTVEGTLLDEKFSSGVGRYAIPSRYGMTVGEFARYVNAEYNLGCDLRVIPCANLGRDDDFVSLGLPWVLPSPNLPTYESVLCYTGTVIFEGTNLSEGRGTTKPFEIFGAPWLRADELAERFNKKGVEGAVLRACCFTPTFSKYAGELCFGVQIHITDRSKFKPFTLGIEIADFIRRTHEEFRFRGEESLGGTAEGEKLFIDLLLGSDEFRQNGFDSQSFIEKHLEGLKKFNEKKEKYLLY